MQLLHHGNNNSGGASQQEFCRFHDLISEGFELLEQLDELPSRDDLVLQIIDMLVVKPVQCLKRGVPQALIKVL